MTARGRLSQPGHWRHRCECCVWGPETVCCMLIICGSIWHMTHTQSLRFYELTDDSLWLYHPFGHVSLSQPNTPVFYVTVVFLLTMLQFITVKKVKETEETSEQKPELFVWMIKYLFSVLILCPLVKTRSVTSVFEVCCIDVVSDSPSNSTFIQGINRYPTTNSDYKLKKITKCVSFLDKFGCYILKNLFLWYIDFYWMSDGSDRALEDVSE